MDGGGDGHTTAHIDTKLASFRLDLQEKTKEKQREISPCEIHNVHLDISVLYIDMSHMYNRAAEEINVWYSY